MHACVRRVVIVVVVVCVCVVAFGRVRADRAIDRCSARSENARSYDTTRTQRVGNSLYMALS